ncbi:MAG TPA: biopolymer transporter ExbD [Chitinophagaceae bacterium]|jgi:biopolymer transport protein ExbD|nr:biopolymer transporter ExbD [Chitinophagaceae bacterium]
MASVDTGGGDSGHKKGPGVKKAKKLSTRVDMTPMVDLGFLLITFFIFTTTMSTPSTMDLYMPKDTKKDEEQNKAKESGALTILLAKDNTIYYYEGQLAPDASNFQSTNFKGIRDVIINKRKEVMANHVHDASCEKIWAENKGDKNSCLDRDFVVIIKPDDDATYKNTVDILDEMTINGVKRFAMVDLFPQEVELIKKTEAGQ